MMNLNHKNFGKKLRMRAGLFVDRRPDPKKKWMEIFERVRKELMESLVESIIGVQPMTGPAGLIFLMNARYGKPSAS